MSLVLISPYDSSANNRHLHSRVANSCGSNAGYISIENDEIGEFSALDRAFACFLKRCIRAIDRVCAQRFLDFDLLIRNPSVRILVIESSPSDCSINPIERSGRSDEPVAPKCEAGTIVQK